MSKKWTPPPDWLRITTIDAHTAGEPLRVITGGLPDIPGETIIAKRKYAREHLDYLRRALMWEPRGHADMYGCIVTEPVTSDGTIGVLFLHNEGFSTMCGHGIIGLAKVGLDAGLIDLPGDNPIIKMDTPAGRVTAFARRESGLVKEVSFENVPSFVYKQNLEIKVSDIGTIGVDIGFGGAFYAFCQASDLGVGLEPADFRELMDIGTRIKKAVAEEIEILHPFEEELSFLYGTIIVGPAKNPANHSRNVCIFADGEVDRCPTGTGVSARAAIHHARGELKLKEPFVVESILGTTFIGQVERTTTFGPFPAIVPKITGSAHITGVNEFVIDPSDRLKEGFILR